MPQTGRPSALSRLAERIERALHGLGAATSIEDVESAAIFVHECMSRRGRIFHSVEHAIVVSNSSDPAQAIAGIFHDIVYWQVDGGIVDKVAELVGPAIEIDGEEVRVAKTAPDSSSDLALVMEIFGFTPGQELGVYGGRNEFLSALVALRVTGRDLSIKAKARIATAVEATFPFRKSDANGSPLERLHTRLTRASEILGLGMTADEIFAATVAGQEISHRDLSSFGQRDPGRFLDNTWQLIPETTFALRTRAYYTCNEYRAALDRMERFLSNLDPELVFMRFRGQPSDEIWTERTEAARNNIAVGARYLRAKLVAAYTVEAFAVASGGDAPVSLFMGDLPDGTPLLHLEDFLPQNPPVVSKDRDPVVERLLVDGRTKDTDFDLKHAPLAAYIYRGLGSQLTDQFLATVRQSISAEDRLRALPAEIRTVVAEAVQKLAPTRAKRIGEVIQRLERN
ncbi:MAG: hypothetical protein HY791_36155 [Deltaproteobacteria bacterium]|nr:hypothetical protein [Deltaproteobacteria bacterium]